VPLPGLARALTEDADASRAGKEKFMKASWVTAGIAAAILAPVLAACGGGSGGGSSSSSTAPTTSPSSGGDGGSTASTGTGGDSGNGGNTGTTAAGRLTPPGAHLSVGQPATVGWVPPSIALKPGSHKAIRFQVTVKSIEKGTIADFKNVELNAKEKKETPYYVTVEIKALTAHGWKGVDDPDITFDAIDDRGQQQGSVTFFGTFPRCDNKSAPKPFVNGKSYTSCITYLMPGGGSIQKMQWNDGPAKGEAVTPYFDNPVVWSAG
jgi:hypothetical protein